MSADVCCHLAFLISYKYILENVSFLSPTLERKSKGTRAQMLRRSEVSRGSNERGRQRREAPGGDAKVGGASLPEGLPDALYLEEAFDKMKSPGHP